METTKPKEWQKGSCDHKKDINWKGSSATGTWTEPPKLENEDSVLDSMWGYHGKFSEYCPPIQAAWQVQSDCALMRDLRTHDKTRRIVIRSPHINLQNLMDYWPEEWWWWSHPLTLSNRINRVSGVWRTGSQISRLTARKEKPWILSFMEFKVL